MGQHVSHLHHLVRLTAWALGHCADQQVPSGEACFDRSCAALGGGQYPRAVTDAAGARLYRVRKMCSCGEFATITQALAQWSTDKTTWGGSYKAIIEIADSAIYHEAPLFRLDADEHIELRAAAMVRPTLRMFDYRSGVPERIVVVAGAGSRFAIDGIVVAGGPLEIEATPGPNDKASLVVVRHCTLVPGWEEAGREGAPWRERASVLLVAGRVSLQIDHSIVGPVRMHGQPESGSCPHALDIRDSIVDSGHANGLAIADLAYGAAAACTCILRSTIIGAVQVEQLSLAENAIFLGCLMVARREPGRLRYCRVAPGSRTPNRLHCQGAQPAFESLCYGAPAYCKLASDCSPEILCGANDDTEMGAWHDLHRSPLVLG